MKVVYLHQYFNTADVAGGTRSYEFARRLVRRGHEVHVVTSTRNTLRASRTWAVTEVEGITVHSIQQPYDNAMSARERLLAFTRFALHAALRARVLKGDVVFATSTPLTIAIPAILASLGRKTPFVMEVRDLWPAVPIAMGYLRNPLARAAARLLESVAYRQSQHIVALSVGMAEGIAAQGTSPSKVSVIPNLSDTQRFRSGTVLGENFYVKFPQLAKRPFVVYTGTFGKVNGVEFMVDLAKAYASLDPQLAFVAMGEGAQKEAVTRYAETVGVLDNNFFVLDSVPKKELPAVLAACVASSSWVIPVRELEANSANKLFDAFAAGRPILINHGGWQSELLESTGAGLALPPDDITEAARTLHTHLSDEAWMEKARAASLDLGVNEFEVGLLFDRFERVLSAADQGAGRG